MSLAKSLFLRGLKEVRAGYLEIVCADRTHSFGDPRSELKARAFIHNERAIAAEQKVTVDFDPNDVVGTARRDGFYQGMMSAYAFLLETDASARRILRDQQDIAAAQKREDLTEVQEIELSSIFAPSVNLSNTKPR